MCDPQRCSHNKDRLQLATSLRKFGKGGKHAVEHCVLKEQVLIGVARERQFRKYNQRGVILSGRLGEFDDLSHIVARISHPHARRGNSRSDKSVLIGRVEGYDGHGKVAFLNSRLIGWCDCRRMHRVITSRWGLEPVARWIRRAPLTPVQGSLPSSRWHQARSTSGKV